MTDSTLHPKFVRPPVIEVVHGVRFRRLDFNIAHPGRFHVFLQDRYPRVQTVPALPPDREFFGAQPFQLIRFEFGLMMDLPRAWFISADDTMLVQLQQDRLLLNWRSAAGDGNYPHYPAVSAEFRRVLEALADFVADAGVGRLHIEQGEMTYVNSMGLWRRDSSMAPDEWLRGWSGEVGPEWSGEMEDFSSTTRYALRQSGGELFGRVTTTTTTIVRPPAGDRSLQIEVTVRGMPDDPSIDGALKFHEIAHDQIVRCFASITTDAAHARWGITEP